MNYLLKNNYCNTSKLFVFLYLYLLLVSCQTKVKQDENNKTNNNTTSDTTEYQWTKSKIVNDSIAEFFWTPGACEHIGQYNSKKYSHKQLTDLSNLVSSGLQLESVVNIDEPNNINITDLATLEREYKAKRTVIAETLIPNTTFWLNLKNNKLKDIDDCYELFRATLQAYSDYSTLKTNRFSNFCSKYVEILNTLDTTILLNSWKELEIERSKKSYAGHMRKYESKYNSVYKLEYAKIELMIAWYNCANSTIYHFEETEEIFNEFDKLFIKIDIECDDD